MSRTSSSLEVSAGNEWLVFGSKSFDLFDDAPQTRPVVQIAVVWEHP
jgi:hypothetical protein